LRYLRWGGRRNADFIGNISKLRKELENAQTPTRLLHVLLGVFAVYDG